MADSQRVCTSTGKVFIITEAEQKLISKLEVLHPLLKVGDIPLPTIHPQEFNRQLQSYVSLMSLFEDKSAISGAPLITRYNPRLGYQVCTYEEFWSDEVDNTSVGRDYDFSRPFFDQWNELMHAVVMQPLVQINCENSKYVDSSSSLKNCYLCFGVGESEGCMYCLKTRYLLRNRDCVDCVGIVDCELCYSCVHCDHAYDCQHCGDCIDCYRCFGSRDLIGCKYCFGCIGLRHAEYYLFNQAVTKEEYEAFVKQANLASFQSRQDYLAQCRQFHKQHPSSVVTIKQSEQSSGRYLQHCHNAYECEYAENLEDCGWVTGAFGRDVWRGEVYQGELAYQSAIMSGRLGFCNSICSGSENFYSYMIWGSNSCFGCAMLKQKSYCILNKQYTKAEYEELVPRIIEHMKRTGEWGQFFPGKYAPHYYKESQAGQLNQPRISQLVQYSPDHEWVDRFDDTTIEVVLGKVWRCTITGKEFKLVRQEVEFYLRQGIPLPRIHWQERLKNLLLD